MQPPPHDAPTLGIHPNTLRRWEARGLLRAVRLSSSTRSLQADDVANPRPRTFSGFAPMREDDDIVPVSGVRSID